MALTLELWWNASMEARRKFCPAGNGDFRMQQIVERVDDGSEWAVLLQYLSQSTEGNWVEPKKGNVFRKGYQ